MPIGLVFVGYRALGILAHRSEHGRSTLLDVSVELLDLYQRFETYSAADTVDSSMEAATASSAYRAAAEK